MKTKYTKPILELAVASSLSYAGVLRELELKQTGGSQSHIKQLIERFGIDTSHFTGCAHQRNKPARNRRNANEILVYRTGYLKKENRSALLRALLEIERKYVCITCGQNSVWQNKEITLQIDHIDGDNFNNCRENLRFLCPNCHSQTDTYGSKNAR